MLSTEGWPVILMRTTYALFASHPLATKLVKSVSAWALLMVDGFMLAVSRKAPKEDIE